MGGWVPELSRCRGPGAGSGMRWHPLPEVTKVRSWTPWLKVAAKAVAAIEEWAWQLFSGCVQRVELGSHPVNCRRLLCVSYPAGAKTGLACFITAWVVGLVLIFLTPVFQNLPYCTLGAIVVSSVTGLLEYEQAIYLFKVGVLCVYGGGGRGGRIGVPVTRSDRGAAEGPRQRLRRLAGAPVIVVIMPPGWSPA